MPANIIFAEEGSITIGGTAYAAEIKEITIGGGTRDMEQVRTFGNNQYADEKPADPIEINLTAVARDSDFNTLVLGGKLVATTGSAFETVPATRRDVRLDFFDLTNVSGAQLRYDAFSAYITGTESTLNSTDHMEQTVTIKCLTKDWKVQSTTNRIVSGVS